MGKEVIFPMVNDVKLVKQLHESNWEVFVKMKNSKKYKLNKEDGLKIVRGAGVAMGGALVVYLTNLLPNVDFGVNTPLIVGLVGIFLNAVRKWLNGKK